MSSDKPVQNSNVDVTLGGGKWPLPPSIDFERMTSAPLPTSPSEVTHPPWTPPGPPPGFQENQQVTAPDPPDTTQNALEAPVCTRPQRAAKRRAAELIRGIQEWEACPESSDLFRRVERRFNEELDAEILTRDERVQLIQHPESEAEAEHDAIEDTTSSEDESPTASLRDFVVSDEEEVPDDNSFRTRSEADNGSEVESDEQSECDASGCDESECGESECDESQCESTEGV